MITVGSTIPLNTCTPNYEASVARRRTARGLHGRCHAAILLNRQNRKRSRASMMLRFNLGHVPARRVHRVNNMLSLGADALE